MSDDPISAYVRKHGLSWSIDTPVAEDPSNGTWMQYYHTGEITVTIGDRRWSEYCWGNLPRAKQAIINRIMADLGLGGA